MDDNTRLTAAELDVIEEYVNDKDYQEQYQFTLQFNYVCRLMAEVRALQEERDAARKMVAEYDTYAGELEVSLNDMTDAMQVAQTPDNRVILHQLEQRIASVELWQRNYDAYNSRPPRGLRD